MHHGNITVERGLLPACRSVVAFEHRLRQQSLMYCSIGVLNAVVARSLRRHTIRAWREAVHYGIIAVEHRQELAQLRRRSFEESGMGSVWCTRIHSRQT